MPNLDDYPFDPSLRVEELQGLEKIRAIQDPTMRELLWSLRRATARPVEPEEPHDLKYLRKVSANAKLGEYGPACRQLLDGLDLRTVAEPELRAAVREVNRIRRKALRAEPRRLPEAPARPNDYRNR